MLLYHSIHKLKPSNWLLGCCTKKKIESWGAPPLKFHNQTVSKTLSSTQFFQITAFQILSSMSGMLITLLSLSSTLHNSTHLRRAHFKCQIWKRIHETSWLGIKTIEFAKFLRAYTTTNLTSLIPQACYRVHFFMLSYFLFLWLIFIIHILSLRKVVCSPILFEHIYTFEVQGDFFTGKPLKS